MHGRRPIHRSVFLLVPAVALKDQTMKDTSFKAGDGDMG